MYSAADSLQRIKQQREDAIVEAYAAAAAASAAGLGTGGAADGETARADE